MANRENNAEAIPYLTKSVDTYEAAISACKAEDKMASVFADLNLSAIDKFLLKKNPETESQVKRIIGDGMELNVLEAGYTQTLFYMAQVYSQKGEIELGIKYCS